MVAFQFCIFSAFLNAIVNFIFRKSSEVSRNFGNFDYYFLSLYAISFCVSILLSLQALFYSFNPVMLACGGLVGVLNLTMLRWTSRALLRGPSGMTFAFQNASGVFPGLIMYGIFGPEFGFEISLFQFLGVAFVLVGLMVGAISRNQSEPISKEWMYYAFGACLVQMIAFSLIHWRCLLINADLPSHALIPWKISPCSEAWFLPGQFGVSFLIQLCLVYRNPASAWTPKEILCGTASGILHAISSFCLLLSTNFASQSERGLIFPLFVVSSMVCCNLWAKSFYREKFNWSSNSLCSVGIFLASPK